MARASVACDQSDLSDDEFSLQWWTHACPLLSWFIEAQSILVSQTSRWPDMHPLHLFPAWWRKLWPCLTRIQDGGFFPQHLVSLVSIYNTIPLWQQVYKVVIIEYKLDRKHDWYFDTWEHVRVIQSPFPLIGYTLVIFQSCSDNWYFTKHFLSSYLTFFHFFNFLEQCFKSVGFKVATYCFLKSEKKANSNLKKYP